jgi:hypothetical protein
MIEECKSTLKIYTTCGWVINAIFEVLIAVTITVLP